MQLCLLHLREPGHHWKHFEHNDQSALPPLRHTEGGGTLVRLQRIQSSATTASSGVAALSHVRSICQLRSDVLAADLAAGDLCSLAWSRCRGLSVRQPCNAVFCGELCGFASRSCLGSSLLARLLVSLGCGFCRVPRLLLNMQRLP